ncbi:MAG TPA: hypothetical protein VK859_17445 [bacterium]|nr:hypothetical protein [bacterium]
MDAVSSIGSTNNSSSPYESNLVNVTSLSPDFQFALEQLSTADTVSEGSSKPSSSSLLSSEVSAAANTNTLNLVEELMATVTLEVAPGPPASSAPPAPSNPPFNQGAVGPVNLLG